jgi:hypothetical protein
MPVLHSSVQQRSPARVYWPAEQSKRILGSYEALHIPMTDLTAILISGCVLTFAATIAFYVWYAATEWESYSTRRFPLPLITDMFTDWPVLSSASLGAGSTLLFTGVVGTSIARLPLDVAFSPRTNLVRAAVVAQASAWIVVCSSYNGRHPQEIVIWVHNVSVGVFIASSGITLEVAHYICRFVCETMASARVERGGHGASTPLLESPWILQSASEAISAARVFMFLVWLGLAAAVAAVTGSSVWESLNKEQSSHFHAQYFWQMLVAAELVIVCASGLSYSLLIYAYVKLEESAQQTVATLAR